MSVFATPSVSAERGNVRNRWRNSTLAIAAAVAALSTTSTASSSTPYSGTPVSIPGTIQAENFDNGGEGIAYHDTTAGNTGGAYRSTGVDLQASSEGGYNIGWTAAGEWLNYTVKTASAGTFTVGLRVASMSGGTMHVGFNGPSNVWKTVSIPATGNWQKWTTVNLTATLGAGVQQMTLLFDNGGVNLNYVTVGTGSTATPTPTPTNTTTSGTTLSVATWNIKVNSTATHARVAMDTLLAIGPRPDVILIQEGWASLMGTYIDELQRQTGRTWHGVFATECAAGQWNGSSCVSTWTQGVAVLSTYSIVNSSIKFFPYKDCWTSARVGLRAGLNVNGVTVQVVATHLQTGGCANDAQSRYASMSLLKAWAAGFSKPQIVGGDFNADPDQIDTTSGMLPAFVDTWSVGSGNNKTAFVSSPTMKLDYLFTDTGLRAQPISSHVFYGSGSASDHFPVQTTFVVR